MIKSKEDYLYYLEADRIAKSKPLKYKFSGFVKNLFSPDYLWEFQKLMRRLEFYTNCKKRWIYNLHVLYLKVRFKKLSIKLGFSIPINTFGPGLSIAHYGTIVVNGNAKIGANCRIHAGVNIGTKAGFADKAPEIGNNCYIGPGAKIYGPIKISNNCAIGANAVVNKSFKQNDKAIGGIPAKEIGEVNTFKLLIPATVLLALKIDVKKFLGMPASEIYNLLEEKIKNE